MGSRAVPGPPADEALVPWALTSAGPLPRRDHAGGELLPVVACSRGRTRGVRGAKGPGGRRTGRHRDRDRGGNRERPGQAPRAPTASLSSSRPALIRMPRSTSFPSGHSAAAFAFVTGACTEMPVLAPVLVPLAGAVAYSRVYTGVHYPSDVVAGVGIGIGSGVLAARLSPRALDSCMPAIPAT